MTKLTLCRDVIRRTEHAAEIMHAGFVNLQAVAESEEENKLCASAHQLMQMAAENLLRARVQMLDVLKKKEEAIARDRAGVPQPGLVSGPGSQGEEKPSGPVAGVPEPPPDNR